MLPSPVPGCRFRAAIEVAREPWRAADPFEPGFLFSRPGHLPCYTERPPSQQFSSSGRSQASSAAQPSETLQVPSIQTLGTAIAPDNARSLPKSGQPPAAVEHILDEWPAARKLAHNVSSPGELSYPNSRGSTRRVYGFMAGSSTEFESTLGSNKQRHKPPKSAQERSMELRR
jgi:hypothetical protein